SAPALRRAAVRTGEPATSVRALTEAPAVARARRILRETDEATLADQAELATIPAPPFGEATRAARLGERFAEAGLVDIANDDAGNVLARLPGPHGEAAPLLLAAHLDTVFPEDTDVA